MFSSFLLGFVVFNIILYHVASFLTSLCFWSLGGGGGGGRVGGDSTVNGEGCLPNFENLTQDEFIGH